MPKRDDSTSSTSCWMSFYSLSATGPTLVPEPLPLLERVRWSVAGPSRKFVWVS